MTQTAEPKTAHERPPLWRDATVLKWAAQIAVLAGLIFVAVAGVRSAAANLEAPEPYVSNLQMRGIECLYRPYLKSVAKHLERLGGDYDLVILSRADAAAKVMPAARRYCTNARVVFDTVDLHFLREARRSVLDSRGIV